MVLVCAENPAKKIENQREADADEGDQTKEEQRKHYPEQAKARP